jgi:hypothetical protein
VVDGIVCRQKSLRVTGGLETLHLPLSSSHWLLQGRHGPAGGAGRPTNLRASL